GRMSRNMVGEMAGEQPRIEVVARADADADDDADGLALVEGGDVLFGACRAGENAAEQKQGDTDLHAGSLLRWHRSGATMMPKREDFQAIACRGHSLGPCVESCRHPC